MKRVDFLATLNLAKPALSSKDIIPIFTNFCFDGSTVVTYDDATGIKLPCKAEIIGAVKGSLLLGLLENSRAKDVEFEQEDTQIIVKAGRSKLKLPFIPTEDFLFEIPSTKGTTKLDIDSDFMKGLMLCAKGASTDTARPMMMGVTLQLSKKKSEMFSTDSETISKFTLKGTKTKNKETYIIPTEFCKNLDKMMSILSPEDPKLYLGEGFAIAKFTKTSLLFSRLIDAEDPLDFEQVMDATIGESNYEPIQIPGAFEAAIKRSLILSEETYGGATTFKIKDKKIKLDTESSAGQIKDVLKLKGKHPNITIKINTKLIARALTMCNEFYALDSCIVFKDQDNFIHMAANMTD